MTEFSTLIAARTDFDQGWASMVLGSVFRKGMKVLILPLGTDEGWASDAREWGKRFEEESEPRYDLERPFRSYGIGEFLWADFFRHTPEQIGGMIRQADILVLVGTDSSSCMDRIEDLGLKPVLLKFQGMIVTLSEASHILEGEFECGEEQERTMRQGIGLLPGVHLFLHYQETEEELRRLIRMLEADGCPILVLPEKSGIYFEGGNFELLGGAFIVEPSDLDEMYSLL